MAHFCIRSGPLLLLALLLSTVPSQAEELAARSLGGYRRDLRRIGAVERVQSLADKLDSASPLTRSRITKGSDTWRFWGEGKRDFSIDMDGCTVSGQVTRYNFPMGATTKVNALTISRPGSSRSLLAPDVPLRLAESTHFWNGAVAWHGPVSRFSVLALLHEYGHAAEWKKMSQEQRAEFEAIYNRKDENLPLTEAQKRTMVGFERRAWASALWQSRTLKRQGFDLLAGVPRPELMNTIYGCLKGYYDYQPDPQPPPRTVLPERWRN